jgi:hypothetical protein
MAGFFSRFFVRVVILGSFQLSAISYQLSAISFLLSVSPFSHSVGGIWSFQSHLDVRLFEARTRVFGS